MTATTLSFLAHGHFRVACYSPFATSAHGLFPFTPGPSRFHHFTAIFSIAFAISLCTATFPQRSLPTVFPHTIACGSFRLFSLLAHPFLGFSHTFAPSSSCLFVVLYTVVFGSLRSCSLLAYGRFSSTCLFAVFSHKFAFGSIRSYIAFLRRLPFFAAFSRTFSHASFFACSSHTIALGSFLSRPCGFTSGHSHRFIGITECHP